MYSYTFRIFAQTDLLVTKRAVATGIETTLALTTDYTVTGVGSITGGSITLVAGLLAAGNLLVIRRVRQLTQDTDIRNQGSFYPEIHEDALDHQMMVQQQQQDELDRSLKLAETVDPATFNTDLPASLVGASETVIMTNVAGNGLSAGPTATAISGASGNAVASAASAAAALASQTSATSSATSATNSATSATTSAATATTQASNASTSATNASTSATNAASSATSAGTSATTATTQASNASTSATNSATSATNSANSATAAGTSATNASNFASTAATSATNASNSATSAGTSATNASNSATAAGTSATNSANSATSAASGNVTASINFPDIATPATPSAGTTKIYSKTDGKLYKLTSTGVELEVGSGAGGGSINHISLNPDAEAATTGWANFADGATLVDGTGGSPTGAISRQSTTILRGTNSFLYTAGGVGDGTGYAFTVPNADKARQISISFDYAYSATVAEGAYQVYIYDVTNSKLIQPSGYKLGTGVSGTYYTHMATFQTSSSGTSYRLILWQSVATPGGNLYFDNVQVGPQIKSSGAPITDWVDESSSFVLNGFGTTTLDSIWTRRVAGSLEVRGTAKAGSTTGTMASITIPTKYVIDSTKIVNTGAQFVGEFQQVKGAAGGFNIAQSTIFYDGSDTAKVYITYQTASGVYTKVATNTLVTTGDNCTFIFSVPIAGWGSSVAMSSSDSQRLVAFRARKAGSQTVTAAAWNTMTFATTDVTETHGAWDATNNHYRIPVAGWYRIGIHGFGAVASATRHLSVGYSVDGGGEILVNAGPGGTSVPADAAGTDTIFLRAGQTVQSRAYPSADTSISELQFTIERLSQNQTIAASELIAAKARLSSNIGIASGAETIVTFNSKEHDTHGAFDTVLNRFVAPAAGYYRAHLSLGALTLASGAAVYFLAGIRKGGTRIAVFGVNNTSGTITDPMTSCTTTLYLLAGEYLDFSTESNDASYTITNSTAQTYCTIERVGGN